MKKNISLCLALLFLCSIVAPISIPVYASDFPNHDQVIRDFISGDVSDIAAVIEASEYYNNADLSQVGYTTSIDDNGRLTATQIIPSSTVSRTSSNATEVASATLMVLNRNGEEIVYTDYDTESNNYSEYAIYAVHTAYYTLTQDSLLDGFDVKVTKITTKFTYNGSIRAYNLYQHYAATEDYLTIYDHATSSTISAPVSGHIYTFYPGGESHPLGIGYIDTESFYTISNKQFSLKVRASLSYNDWTHIIN